MFTQIHISIFILSALCFSTFAPPFLLLTYVFFSSLMKTSVSSLNVMIWTRVWETYSQKGKPWLCQNQSLTLIAIRSAKMTVREASVGKEFCHCISCLGTEFELCCEALQLRGMVDFAIFSFIIWDLLFLSLCLCEEFCNCLSYFSF